MSVAAELLIAEIAAVEAGPGLSYLSRDGGGGPLLTHLTPPPTQIAERCEPGFFAQDGAVAPTTPLNLEEARERLGASSFLIVDAAGEEAGALIDAARRLRPGGADAVRLRGVGAPPPGLARHHLLPGRSAEDRVFQKSPPSPTLRARALAFARAEIDEFDALRAAVARPGAVVDLQFRAWGARVGFAPLAVARRPDRRQRLMALSASRLGFDEEGGAALSLPFLSARPGPIGAVVDGLTDAAPDPIAAPPPGWEATTSREGGVWRFEARPTRPTPMISAVIELFAPEAEEAWIAEAWSGAERARGAWEDWDEAEAQLTLEESW